MYTIKINNEKFIAKDYAVVNLEGNKTLYIRLESGFEIEFNVNNKNWSVKLK